MNHNRSLEQKGADLLAGLDLDQPTRKIQLAPDVQPGDAVFLNGETGQYERVKSGAFQHGIYNGYDIELTITPVPTYLSLIDGTVIIDPRYRYDDEDEE